MGGTLKDRSRLGKQVRTDAVIAPGGFNTEVIRHDSDLPRVLHVWGSIGQYHVTRPWISGTLHQECNGIVRIEKVQIPWSGRAFNVLPGEVWLTVSVANTGASPAPPPDAMIYATIAPGLAVEGECLALRLDAVLNSAPFDAEDPNYGCPFATALLVSGHGSANPYNVTYDGGAAAVGTESQVMEVDWRSKVTINILGAAAVSVRWRYFR